MLLPQKMGDLSKILDVSRITKKRAGHWVLLCYRFEHRTRVCEMIDLRNRYVSADVEGRNNDLELSVYTSPSGQLVEHAQGKCFGTRTLNPGQCACICVRKH